MSKSVVIAEGGQAVVSEHVRKIAVQEQGGGGLINWIPEDEANDYADVDTLEVNENGSYYASQFDLAGYNEVYVNLPLGTKVIDNVGVYNAADEQLAGYASVEVTSAGTNIIDHTPTTTDISHSKATLVEYDKTSTPHIIDSRGLMYRAESVYVEIPTSNEIDISPKNQSVVQGEQMQFTSNSEVMWSIHGSTSDNTTISASGLLTIGNDEPIGTTIMIMATSVTYLDKFMVTTVNVVED